ncbi:MAG: Rieske 2Fe-2S domain-containing protein [Planctomycetaceae bacterium]|nr:Rieske 2Fe-2S domain-containing protein [Planctomycetaceae bacterium]MCA9042945.1 Rieske 2Fe-2S domain-containing protein [Planctomycetaceae bacterium]MCB9949710.1 Rieske 2Fe-2S domain-containing protein [Planctomycetaceae bacterium]
MSVLRHWHPVCLSSRLGRRPVMAQVEGHEIVLFRTATGQIGALDNSCVHRRMRLSCGKVAGEHLVCPYHGWTFNYTGAGESPGTPKMTAQAPAYDVREEWNYLWIRQAGSNSPFPDLSVDGFAPVRPLEHTIDAPLEVVLDNFTEAKHVASVHSYFGYDLDRMAEVQSHVEPSEFEVRVRNTGPQRSIPFPLRWAYAIKTGDTFHWEWVTRFAPVHVTYDEFWTDPQSGQQRGVHARIRIFFYALDDHRTRLVTFAAFKLPFSPVVNGFFLMFRDIARWLVGWEMSRDADMLAQLADKSPGIEGMKLSRFDRLLALHRDRIERVYRE